MVRARKVTNSGTKLRRILKREKERPLLTLHRLRQTFYSNKTVPLCHPRYRQSVYRIPMHCLRCLCIHRDFTTNVMPRHHTPDKCSIRVLRTKHFIKVKVSRNNSVTGVFILADALVVERVFFVVHVLCIQNKYRNQDDLKVR